MYGIVRLYRVGHEFLMKSKLLLLGHFWPKLQPSSTWPHFDFEVYIIYGIYTDFIYLQIAFVPLWSARLEFQ